MTGASPCSGGGVGSHRHPLHWDQQGRALGPPPKEHKGRLLNALFNSNLKEKKKTF